ncbi:hypothetical protein CDD80_2953 [Ophiocordyceps camponoti-rufipedis]|uniref:Zn(2)-C6 fungal-type domain-containing protein n=1 Tax=Ophiocordyceps camponoti-rufipedis TaxID=2004952 RepID=A0A2C5Z4J1_9HYPO|nr:hypothetical protein CDD80_2953 [Ophiocordyceps camponoti-rufipedis]
MTPTPPITYAGSRSPEEQFRVVRRRNRVPLSCLPCRTRKKCDRNHPCGNCTRREGMSPTCCSYATPSPRKKAIKQEDSSPDDMQNRIDRLEGLVLSLMHNTSSPEHTATRTGASASISVTDSGSSAKAAGHDETAMVDDDSDVDDGLATSLGVLKVDADKGKSMYIGQEHWHLLLADISEVKNYFSCHKKELETSYERVRSSKPVTAREGPTLLLGAVPASEQQLRDQVPSKSSVLTLCSRYFNSMDNSVSIIHGPTFLRQLRSHWEDPSTTPIMWLGLLYSILCLAMLSYHKVGDEPLEWKGRTLEVASEFRLRTVQCLVGADYTKPVEYTVETMILYVFGEYSSRWDVDLGLWLIVSSITRIAFRMGYHRDAQWFPSLSPFQAEMRRRTWALVRICDVVFSHQVSLPSMIYEHDCDTQLPNNLLDDDFHLDTTELPPPRPNTDATPISYLIAKARLCNELGNVLQTTNKVGRNVSYDEIVRFDAKLRQVIQELPPHLQLGLAEDSRDAATLVVARFSIDILYQKILCLLHRKYMSKARQNPRYAHSRRSAIDASLQALAHLRTLHRESLGDGRLRTVAWYVKSIATKEFILPAMLIVLDLHFDNMASQSGAASDHDGAFLWSADERSSMISALHEAAAIWRSLADTSMEAFKAAKVIDIMLHKIANPNRSPEAAGCQGANAAVVTPIDSPNMIAPEYFVHSNDMLNSFSNVNSSALFGMEFSLPNMADPQVPGFNAAGPASPLSMFTNLGGAAADPSMAAFDWGAFENYTQMATWGSDQGFPAFGPAEASSDHDAGLRNVQ